MFFILRIYSFECISMLMSRYLLLKLSRRAETSLFLFCLCGLMLFLFPATLSAQDEAQADTAAASTGSVTLINIDGSIDPTTLNYIERGLTETQDRGDEAFIIQLNTPGGLLNTTQDIVELMLNTSTPTVVYVAPDGANAGSAGTFITMAAHVAAMAPASSIGAASPVSMGGGEVDSVSQKKIFNYTESFIENIAEKRGRNVEWAIDAVRDGRASTSSEALELNVIDVIAENRQDLLSQLHGMEIEGRVLNTENAEINEIEPNLAERFFGFIIRPEVMLILTLVALYGILGEVSSPGAIIPGVSGVIALILLLYGVAAMPINTAGFLLIGLALILFAAEAFTPTYGILLGGGGVSFFLGALMLFQDLPEDMQVSLSWLIPATILTILVFAWISYYGIRAQFTGHRAGTEAMINKKAKVKERVDENGGVIFVDGERWNAVSPSPIEAGEHCEIVSFEGLKVHVKPLDDKPA
jgi:membrane-bound serine protease (ClpP class)